MPLFIVPAASVGPSAILMPSGRMNGKEPIVISNRDAADTVEVEINARKLVGFVRLAFVASVWHSVSAVGTPVDGSKSPLDMKATRPVTAGIVSVWVRDVSKQ